MIDAVLSGVGGTLWTLATFIIALGIIVTIHEYGHYIVARWTGIRAEVFSIGFGPVIAQRTDRRGTVWQIAALPLGGYVRFLGDADVASAGKGLEVDPQLARQTLDGAPLWARALTVAAGPAFNFILSALVFGLLAMWTGGAMDKVVVGKLLPAPPAVENQLAPGDEVMAIDGHPVRGWADLYRIAGDDGADTARPHEWQVRRGDQVMTLYGPSPQPAIIMGVVPRSPAVRAGLREGDVITQLNGQPVDRFSDLSRMVSQGDGEALAMNVWRADGGEFTTTLQPRQQDVPDGAGGFLRRWSIGVYGGGSYFTPATRNIGPFEALGLGVSDTWGVIAGSVTGLRAMITGEISRCNLGGAISIAEGTGQMAQQGILPFIGWIALLSAAIGFLNLLPVPVLDGGHLAFYAYEAAIGRPPPERARSLLTSIGLVLVAALMIFGLTNDISCP